MLLWNDKVSSHIFTIFNESTYSYYVQNMLIRITNVALDILNTFLLEDNLKSYDIDR